MTENGWQAIGRIAKERRERMGLRQDELAHYGGPRVSTVGKFERGAQASFPLRTQHQMEKALGWPRTTIEQVVASINEGALKVADWEWDLIEEDIPDLSSPAEPSGVDEFHDDQLEAFAQVFRLVPSATKDAALRAALVAVLPFLDVDGSTKLGRGLRESFPPIGGDGDADADAGGSAPNRTLKSVEVDEAAYDPDDKE